MDVRGEINRLKQDYLVTTERDKFRTTAARKQAEVGFLSKLADLYAEIARTDPLNNWTQLLKVKLHQLEINTLICNYCNYY